MAYSRVQYTQSVAGNKSFVIPFPYLRPENIQVSVQGIVVTYTYVDSQTILTDVAPNVGDVVDIRRITPTEILVNYTDGSTLTELELDTTYQQSLFLAQEAIDTALDALQLGTDGTYDALGHRIKNLGTPVNPSDAVTKAYADSVLDDMQAAVDQAEAYALQAAGYAQDAADQVALAAAQVALAEAQVALAADQVDLAAGYAQDAADQVALASAQVALAEAQVALAAGHAADAASAQAAAEAAQAAAEAAAESAVGSYPGVADDDAIVHNMSRAWAALSATAEAMNGSDTPGDTLLTVGDGKAILTSGLVGAGKQLKTASQLQPAFVSYNTTSSKFETTYQEVDGTMFITYDSLMEDGRVATVDLSGQAILFAALPGVYNVQPGSLPVSITDKLVPGYNIESVILTQVPVITSGDASNSHRASYAAFVLGSPTYDDIYGAGPQTTVTNDECIQELTISYKVVNDRYVSKFIRQCDQYTGLEFVWFDISENQSIKAALQKLATATIASGIIDTSSTVELIDINSTTLRITPTGEMVFRDEITTAADYGVRSFGQVDIGLSSVPTTGDGIHLKYVSYDGNGQVVFTDYSVHHLDEYVQLGYILIKEELGVKTFIDATPGLRNKNTIPDIAAYSNLERTVNGIEYSGIFFPNSNLTFGDTGGTLTGQSINWMLAYGGTDINSRGISPSVTTTFTPVSPASALSVVAPATTTLVDPTKYWNGTAEVSLSGANTASVQRIMITSRGGVVVQIGEAEYATLTAAHDASAYAPFSEVLPARELVEIARIAMKKSCTNLSDNSQAIWIIGGGSGGGGSGSSLPSDPDFNSVTINSSLLRMRAAGSPTNYIDTTVAGANANNMVSKVLSSESIEYGLHGGLSGDATRVNRIGVRDGLSSGLNKTLFISGTPGSNTGEITLNNRQSPTSDGFHRFTMTNDSTSTLYTESTTRSRISAAAIGKIQIRSNGVVTSGSSVDLWLTPHSNSTLNVNEFTRVGCGSATEYSKDTGDSAYSIYYSQPIATTRNAKIESYAYKITGGLLAAGHVSGINTAESTNFGVSYGSSDVYSKSIISISSNSSVAESGVRYVGSTSESFTNAAAHRARITGNFNGGTPDIGNGSYEVYCNIAIPKSTDYTTAGTYSNGKQGHGISIFSSFSNNTSVGIRLASRWSSGATNTAVGVLSSDHAGAPGETAGVAPLRFEQTLVSGGATRVWTAANTTIGTDAQNAATIVDASKTVTSVTRMSNNRKMVTIRQRSLVPDVNGVITITLPESYKNVISIAFVPDQPDLGEPSITSAYIPDSFSMASATSRSTISIGFLEFDAGVVAIATTALDCAGLITLVLGE